MSTKTSLTYHYLITLQYPKVLIQIQSRTWESKSCDTFLRSNMMYISHLKCFRIKASRNVCEVCKLVQEVLLCLRLFNNVLEVKIRRNFVVRCLIHSKKIQGKNFQDRLPMDQPRTLFLAKSCLDTVAIKGWQATRLGPIEQLQISTIDGHSVL